MIQQNYLDIMLRLVQEGGRLSLSIIDDSQHSFKADTTIVTKADKAISRLAHEHLADVLRDPRHILIDEEDPKIIDYLDQNKLESVEYIWALDPIDGTRLYANRLPTFGISIGLLKNLKPWMGVVYFPMLHELFYCDGEKSYYVKNAFRAGEKKTEIVPIDEEISAKTLFYCNDTFFRRYKITDPTFHVLIQACAVVNLLWPTIGRGVGCFLRSSLWDFAGSWPMLRSAGLDLRSSVTGQTVEKIHADMFIREPKPWELKEYYLVSSQRNFPIIRSKMSQLTTF